MYTVEIHKSKKLFSQRYYWLVRHDNGKILLTSEMYHNLQDVIEVAGRFSRVNKIKLIDL